VYIALTEQELDALAGTDYSLTVLYMTIKRFMDYKTGIVGYARRISYQCLSEYLYIEPRQGVKGGAPSQSAIRRMIDQLIKHGLLRKSRKDTLVFKLPLADVENYAQNKADRKSTPIADTVEAAPVLDLQHKADRVKTAKADTPHLSLNTLSKLPPPNTVTVYDQPPEKAGEGVDNYLIYPNGLSKQHRESIAKLMQGLTADVKQDLLDELAGSMAYAKVTNTIGYMRTVSQKAKAGLFIPELAFSVRQQRERVLANQQAYEAAAAGREQAAPTQPRKKSVKPSGMASLRDVLKSKV